MVRPDYLHMSLKAGSLKARRFSEIRRRRIRLAERRGRGSAITRNLVDAAKKLATPRRFPQMTFETYSLSSSDGHHSRKQH